MRIVEGANDRRRVAAQLQHAKRPKRNGAAPPQPAAQVSVGERNERQGADDRARARDASRFAIVDKRLDEESADGEQVPSRGRPEPSGRRVVSCECAADQRTVPILDVRAPRPHQRVSVALDDHHGGHREYEPHREPQPKAGNEFDVRRRSWHALLNQTVKESRHSSAVAAISFSLSGSTCEPPLGFSCHASLWRPSAPTGRTTS
jgi:hypothetical protein